MDSFVLKTLLSFIVGGVWIAGTTWMAERFGTRAGGFIGGLPSTIVVSLFFIAWLESPEHARAATGIIPYALSSNLLFLAGYAALAVRGAAPGLGAALGLWAVLQFGFIRLDPTNFGWGLAFNMAVLVLSHVFVTRALGVRGLPALAAGRDSRKLAVRTILGGGTVALAVLMSRLSGPLLGGIFSVFPAAALSTLWFSYRAGGLEFSRSLVPAFMLSMTININVYTIAYRQLVVDVPLALAILLSYLAAMASAFVLWRLTSYRPATVVQPGR